MQRSDSVLWKILLDIENVLGLADRALWLSTLDSSYTRPLSNNCLSVILRKMKVHTRLTYRYIRCVNQIKYKSCGFAFDWLFNSKFSLQLDLIAGDLSLYHIISHAALNNTRVTKRLIQTFHYQIVFERRSKPFKYIIELVHYHNHFDFLWI